MPKETLYRCDSCGNEFRTQGPFAGAPGTTALVEVRVPYYCARCGIQMPEIVSDNQVLTEKDVVWPVTEGKSVRDLNTKEEA